MIFANSVWFAKALTVVICGHQPIPYIVAFCVHPNRNIYSIEYSIYATDTIDIIMIQLLKMIVTKYTYVL